MGHFLGHPVCDEDSEESDADDDEGASLSEWQMKKITEVKLETEFSQIIASLCVLELSE